MLISLTLIWLPMTWIDDRDSLKWTIQHLQFFPPSHWHSLALNFVATWCTYTPSQGSEKEIKDFLSSLSLSVLNLTLDYQNMQFFCKKWITLKHLHFLPQNTFWFEVWIMTKTVARWFYLVWFSVVKQQHLPFLNIPEWEAQGLTSLFFIIWLSSQCCVWMSPLSLFFHKLHICVFTSRGLKARKPFQIDLQGRNQNSGDSRQVRTRPVREKQATRWCPHGQTRDSHPCTVKLYMSM